jgi:hypothetical protein
MGEVFYLDEVTSALWCFLSEPRHNVEIVQAVTEAFPDTGRDRIAADIEVGSGGMDLRCASGRKIRLRQMYRSRPYDHRRYRRGPEHVSG